jgi:HEAT repeat protein
MAFVASAWLAAMLCIVARGGDPAPDAGVYRRSMTESIIRHVSRQEHEMIVRDALELKRNSNDAQLGECSDLIFAQTGKTLYGAVHESRRACARCGGRHEWQCANCDGRGYHQGTRHGRIGCWLCFETGVILCQACGWRYYSPECVELERRLSTLGAPVPRAPSAEDELKASLSMASSPDGEVALKGIERLGPLADGQPRALAALTNALRSDSDPLKRQFAASIMGKSKSAKCIEALVRSLRNDLKNTVRCAAAEALAEIGDASAAAVLLDAIKTDRSQEVRKAALEASGVFAAADDPCRKMIASALDDRANPVVRAAGARGAGRSRCALFKERLVELLRSDDQIEVRCTAAGALGAIGNRDGIAAIEAAFGKDNPEPVKLACLRAMSESGDERMLPLMIGAFASESAAVSREAVEAVAAFDRDKAIGQLLAFASDAAPKIRALVAVCLGKIDDERVVLPLIAMMDDGDPEARLAAVEAFAAAGDRRGLGRLEAIQSGTDARLSAAAGRAIACVKDRRPGD